MLATRVKDLKHTVDLCQTEIILSVPHFKENDEQMKNYLWLGCSSRVER